MRLMKRGKIYDLDQSIVIHECKEGYLKYKLCMTKSGNFYYFDTSYSSPYIEPLKDKKALLEFLDRYRVDIDMDLLNALTFLNHRKYWA